MPQAGEFGFVLFSLSVGYGILSPQLADTLVIVVTLSMILSPLLMMVHAKLDPVLAEADSKRRAFDSIENSECAAGRARIGEAVRSRSGARRVAATEGIGSPAQPTAWMVRV
jgi:hypothetical protein